MSGVLLYSMTDFLLAVFLGILKSLHWRIRPAAEPCLLHNYCTFLVNKTKLDFFFLSFSLL